MNKVFLIGRLTKDPDLRYTQSGQAVVSFSLAVDRGLSKQKRQEMESMNRPTADFPRITVWGVQAENVSRYLKKGNQCAIDGRIQTGSYQDKDGKMVYTTDVIADRVEFLESRSDGQYQNNPMNQDNGFGNMNQENSYNNSNNFQQNNNQNMNNNDDFFDDDFTEIEDDGRIPF